MCCPRSQEDEVSVVRAEVTDAVLDAAGLADQAADPRCGAVVSFVGVVRNHNAGASVQELDYSCHPTAQQVLAGLAEQAAKADGVHAVLVSHRTGALAVGDVAMVAVVAAEHRGQAFQTCAELVDRVKAEVPIWKREVFADGTHRWTGLER
jgi:molybdopterin synthase catalytic subunit